MSGVLGKHPVKRLTLKKSSEVFMRRGHNSACVLTAVDSVVCLGLSKGVVYYQLLL